MKNNIKLNNQKELESFLKLVAQESVKKSLRESDRNVENYKKQKKLDAKYFGSIKESEEEQKSTNDELEKKEPQPEVNLEDNEDEDIIDQITPRMVIAKINNIRAGLSLKNKEVKENLITFLEKLDDNELLVLFYYLGDISKILNQKMSGHDATDPSEDPLNISMTRSSDKEKPEDPDQNIEKPEQIKKEKEVEDTSPPIKVNESQEKDLIRRKIRILMS